MESNDLKKIERYIRGQADDDERKSVESLFADGEDNYVLKELLRQDWEKNEDADSRAQFDQENLLNTIYGMLWKSEYLKYKSPVKMISRAYMRAAAILLLPVLAFGVLFYFQAKVYTSSPAVTTCSIAAPMGSRISFELPDGTKGMLNGGSHLDYSVPFSKREIKLDGEAWLSVMHDEAHPFVIKADSSKIQVLGTKLNVSAYHDENYVEVILQEGKVDFYKDNGTEKISLRPSERLVLENGHLDRSFVDTAKYTSWVTGKLIFRGDSMPEVARHIERWFNVKVIIADPEIRKYSFRATFQDDSLEEVIRCLALTSPVTYKITPRRLTGDGIFQKTEVKIYKSR